MKKISKIFLVLALLLSHVMVSVVAYGICDMQWGIRYEAYSAPVWVATLYAIPYLIAITVCLVVAFVTNRKANITNEHTG